jgi:hypothetical protein
VATETTLIQSRLSAIKEQIAALEIKYRRQPHSVQLLAVSKVQPITKIEAAFDAGQTCFGENYVQEALAKITALADKPIEWHFIGHVQRNKTRKIAEHFAWVHSVCDADIATRLNDQRPSTLPPLQICIEVNISLKPEKAGIAIEDVLPLARHCLTLPNITLRGLMAIPAPYDDFAKQSHEFKKLSSLAESLRAAGIPLDTLSMGMTDDFEAAIAEGATMLRIGRAIFGQRYSKHIIP